MTTTSDICVSVDVGCHRHSVAIGLPSGQVLDEFDVEHRPEGFTLFFDRIDHLQQQYGGAVSVAMEGYNGWARPLDTLVRSHGYRLFNINLKLARFKEIFPSAAKSTALMRVRDWSSFSSATIFLVPGACSRRWWPPRRRTTL